MAVTYSTALSHKTVREILDYDPASGHFWWKQKIAKKVVVGTRAGGKGYRGYRQIRLFGQQYPEHRAVWFWVYGTWPERLIDHVNGVPNDNRIENLRLATHAQNGWNADARRRNASGVKGVWQSKDGRWQAQITANKIRHHLGSFGSADEAKAAHVEAARRIHGEFARVNGA